VQNQSKAVTIQGMPSRVPADIRLHVEPVRLLVLDVDGTLTDGRLWFSPRGDELKSFDVRDGLIIRLLLRAGIQVAVITGRTSMAVALRCRELGFDPELVVQGSRNKPADLDRIENVLGLRDHQVAAMGDDLPDLPMLGRAGFSACPGDAVPEVAAACDFVCGAHGGRGAVREVGELILKAQGRWAEFVEPWMRTTGSAGEGD
jgi:3-deoxy-D-manno-octulosonate 8-phosphate phosphatase (KDO 8-P phosphatase)